MSSTSARIGFVLVASLGSALGCASAAPDTPSYATEELGEVSDAIVGGVRAETYPEAALVDMSRGGRTVSICSGSIIAPRVVLTAGHCVDGTRVCRDAAAGARRWPRVRR